MAVHGSRKKYYEWERFTPDLFLSEAARCDARALMETVLDEVGVALRSVPSSVVADLPQGFPPACAQSIAEGLDLMRKTYFWGV